MRTQFILLLILAVESSHLHANNVTFATLSPHLTELVFSAGAGHLLVGVSAYSNFPSNAKQIPVISDAFRINQELLIQLKPTHVLYWQSNTAQQMIDQITNLGIKAVPIKTNNIADIPIAIKTIAQLAGTTFVPSVEHFIQEINTFKQTAINTPPLTALIQISDRPIYTVNNNHWMSESLGLCGMTNIFADLPIQSASVDIESILVKNPDVIIRFTPLKPDNVLARHKQIKAITNNNIIIVNPDHFSRPTLRLLEALKTMCQFTF